MKGRKSILTVGGVFVVGILALALLFGGSALPANAAPPRQANPTPTATIGPIISLPANGNQAGTLGAFQGQLTQLYNQVADSVVSISILGTPPQGSFSQFPFQTQPQQQPEEIIPLGAGSGVVWDNQGHIVTNNHVVENAQQLMVTFHDGTSARATVIGTDPYSDLAVIDVDVPASQLHPIRPGSMSDVQVGDLAFALGNPYGLGSSFSMGLVSALGRELPTGNGSFNFSIPSIIQTSAPINPGNSGGALVGLDGSLIGIPTAIISASGAGSGVGFAIPVSIVKAEVPTLIRTGQFQHAYLGITGTSLTAGIAQQMGLSVQNGALIVDVDPNGPAAKAGLSGGNRTVTINGVNIQVGGDVITAINGQPIQNMQELTSYLTLNAKSGETVTLTILRNGQSRQVSVTLAARPSANIPQTGGTSRTAGVQMGILAAPLTSDLLQQYNLPSGTQGVLVGPVTPNSPADQAGVQPGDIITALNGHNVTSPQDLRNQLDQVRPGESATVTILRSGQTLQLTLHFSQSQQSPTAVPAPSNTPAPSPNGTQLIPNTDLQLLESFVGIQAGVINSNSSAQAFNLPANTRGIYINKITPGSPASQTVLQSGDVITGMNGQDILTQVGVAQLIRAIISGRQITLDVLRNGSTLQIPINAGSALAPTSTPSTLALNLQALESFIGVQAQIVNSSAAAQSFNLPANTRGIYISNILPGSIASQTTLQSGDVITGMNGQNVSTSLDLAQLTQNILSGQQVTLDVLRNGSTAQIPLNLGF